jgi:CarD family transcriptional regulator
MKSLKIGDKVIYPNQGLGVIEAIHEEAYNGERFTVYNLRIICNNTLVTVPSATALELGIRRPMEEDSIRKIFQFMGNGAVDVSADWKGRYKEHLNLMKSGTLFDMATVLKISEAVASPCAKIEEKLLGTLSRSFKTAKPRVAA